MGGGLVNLFNMKNISWDCYCFLTALLPLYHIWQQTIPCCLCSPCPFLPFFRHHSFHFPFISPIVHHHLPSNPTPLSLLINGQFKMSVLLLSPHLLFFTFPPASCSSMSSIPTLPSLPISPSLLPSQWATVRHPGPLTRPMRMRWGTLTEGLMVISGDCIFPAALSPVTCFCEQHGHLTSMKWE